MALIDMSETYQMTNVGAHIDGTDVYQSNDNLLDNAYFVGGGSQLGDGVFPINQRGQTSYTTYQVTIDRWTLFGGSVVLAADGITVTSSPDFAQVFEPSRLPVGTYTASVKTADGKIGSITFTTTGSQFFAGGAMGDTGVTLNFIDLRTSDKSLFSLQCQGVKIAAAKLEKGTVSTLANDPPPNFGLERLKCQQYLYVVNYPAYSYTGEEACTVDASSANWILKTPVPMRQNTIPQVSATGVLYMGGATMSNLTSVAYPYGNNVKISLAVSGLTTGQLYPITSSAYDSKLTISCEL